MQTIFDGHNDVLWRLWERARKTGLDSVEAFCAGTPGEGQLDRPRARAGGMVGGLCAIYVPSHVGEAEPDHGGRYDIPLPPPRKAGSALTVALEMASLALRIERAGGWTLCRSTAGIEEAVARGDFAAVLHLEGCEPIGADLVGLDVLHAAGLRSLGPVWSRPNIFGYGVPFAFPRSPDTGGGLTDAGKALVRACDELGILVDLAHITEKGFWDVAAISSRPLVASHSNAHALTPAARNLTDRQLDAIGERRGLVGLNFAVTMLRADGRRDRNTPLDDMIRHIDHLVGRVGIDCVALGSDFDGAEIPAAIGDAAGLQNLVAALRAAGYGGQDVEKICRDNWLRILRSAWKEDGGG